ncbi:MAG: ABC transporter substrate-binding protein [Defluviitaleaceae bacterium]|nr:ABC transporter substrate-binding protein [Defluviitaleaceae bacterium]MCL2835398.1 ABC transporter substrate-binding protein [Defluviitaleaceae bacterium]
MKKVLATALAVILTVGLFSGCMTQDEDTMYISVISKGFQHQFWQTVKAGSDAAAEDLGVRIFFTGPEGESAIADQINMIDAELAKGPDAIALAALDTEAVLSQLQDAYNRNIPVIGFDSGVPDAPAGQIAANASTDNEAAAALAAEKLFEVLEDKLTAATADSPVVLAVLSQDATSASVTGRTRGFVEKMAELAAGVNDSVAIRGGLSSINKGDANAAVIVEVVVGATPDITDMTNAANGLLNTENLASVFCSNEGAVTGLLAAINAGASVPDGVLLVGFDAGAAQKDAVRSGLFMGAITQDPFQIGYQAVALAVKAARGEAVADIDTGAKWYDAGNMDEPSIAILLYD